MRKTNKIIAMLIILCMLLLIVPFKVFALTDAEKEELVEIAMQNATNISISEDKATITYENGIVEITANNLQAYKNDNYDFVGRYYVGIVTISLKVYNMIDVEP